MSPNDLDALLAVGPILIRVGSANILGEVRFDPEALSVELAQIEGGGEGVLLRLGVLAERLARARGLVRIDWVVHAVHCAQPNPKLRRVLERRGFQIAAHNGASAYLKSQILA